jgi:hypothetical protein
LDLDN